MSSKTTTPKLPAGTHVLPLFFYLVGSFITIMSYTYPIELIQRFGFEDMVSLSRKDYTSEEISLSTIDDAIVKTGAIIDAYLASRYNIPLHPVPSLIQAINTDLAYAELFTKNKPPFVQQLEKFNLELLQKIADGTLKLADTPEKNNVHIEAQPPLFDRKTLKVF